MTQKDKRTNICFNFIDLSHLQQVSWFLKNIVTKKSRRRFWVCPAAQEISGLKIHGQLRTTNIENGERDRKTKIEIKTYSKREKDNERVARTINV